MALNVNICGVNAIENSLRTQVESIENLLKNNLEATASSLVSTLSGGLLSLNISIGGLFTGKPTVGDISLQAEIKDLATFSVGSSGYTAKFASITSRFSTALKGEGLEIVALAVAALTLIKGGLDICDLVPNLTVDSDGSVTLSPKNVLLANGASTGDFVSSTITKITANALAIELSNAGIKARFDCNVSGVKIIFPKLCISIGGENSRTTEESRILFREADIKIENAMLNCGVTLEPVDNRSLDIKNNDKNLPTGAVGIAPQLLCITGSPGGVLVTLEAAYDQAIDETLQPLRDTTSKYGELISKSTKPYPDNLNSDATKIFFNNNTTSFTKHIQAHRQVVRIQNQFADVLSKNRVALNNDVTSKQFEKFKEDSVLLENKLKQNIIDFEASFSRDITPSDSIIDEAVKEVRDVTTLVVLPKIDLETDTITV